MQSEKKRDPCCESQTAKETTNSYLTTSAYGQYRYIPEENDLEKVLAQFINLETGVCLECGVVHGFTNIVEANRRHQKNNSSPYLDRLFWEAPPG
jgi:hypothetical protein